MIHAARKSRQKAREMGTDYIPIEETKRYFILFVDYKFNMYLTEFV